MDRIWIAAILISTVFPVYAEDKVPSLASSNISIHGLEHLICFLRKEPPKECTNSTIDVSKIPLRLKQLYQRMGEELKDYIVKGSLALAPAETFSELHPVLFYLMPNGDKRLSAEGQALARIVRAQGGDTAAIIASAALLGNTQERDLFVKQLAGVNLPERSQVVLGEYLAEWFMESDTDWKFERFSKAVQAGNPLVGSLPPPFLTSLLTRTTERFLYFLSQWEPRGVAREEQWYSKGKKVMRTWSYMAIKAKYPHPLADWTTPRYTRYTFLLLGFTPDELLTMAIPHKDVRANIFKLRFDKLQARAVFEAVFGKGNEIKANDLKNGIPVFTVPILTMLSPRQLVRYFNHSITDFGVLNYPSAKAFNEPSLATAKQLAHCLIAQSMFGRLKNSSSIRNDSKGKPEVNAASVASVLNSTSTSSITKRLHESLNVTLRDFINGGHFIYSLNLSYFITQNISKISLRQITLLNSNNISPRQARLLTRHLIIHLDGDAVTSRTEYKNQSLRVTPDELISFGPGLLRGLLSTSTLTSLDMRRLPQRVMQHLLTTDRPWTNGVPSQESQSLRSLAILQKIRSEIGQDWILKHVLSNGDSAQLLKYLTPREITSISQSIMNDATFLTLSGLHPKTLSVLLDTAIPELKLRGPGGGKWVSEGLAPGAAPLLRGLHCAHLDLVDPLDVVVVLGQFNKQRKAKPGVKYQPFPKHLQHCAIRALAFHLKAKASLWEERGETLNFSSHELLYVLDGSDIESVGGYVIAGLPKMVLQFLGVDAVRLVGGLSPQELLSALFGNHHPSDVANILLVQLGIHSRTEIHSNSSEQTEHENQVHRLEDKWLEWKGKEPSLMPLLFGSLLPFLTPDMVEPASLKWALETAEPGDSLVCLGSDKRDHWYSVLRKAFGEPETWTPSTLSIIGDFLLVVPPDMLQRISIDSWTNAADSLIEKSRYFAKDINMPRGLENYVQACTKFLVKDEWDSYFKAVKRLARYYLIASQLQLNEVSFYKDLIRSNFSKSNEGRFSQGNLFPVPGLRKPPIKLEDLSEEELPIYRKERVHGSIGPKWSMVIKITCEAIRASGPGIAGASVYPEDIELMSPQEVWECADIFGGIDLEDNALKVVWMKIKNQTDQVLELQDLGKIVRAMSDEDLMKFNVSITSNLDAVFVLGRELQDWKMVTQWAKKVLPEKLDKPLNVEVVAALGGLLCGIPETAINQTLMPHVILWAAPFLAQALGAIHNRGCPPAQCIKTLGKLAAVELGNPFDGWSEMELAVVDILAAGFPEDIWNALDMRGNIDSAMSGLQISAIECMPDHIRKGLSISQISQLSPLTFMGLDEKKDIFTEKQRSVFKELVRTPFDEMKFLEVHKEKSVPEVDEKDEAEDVHTTAGVSKAYSFTILYSLPILSLLCLR